MLAGQRRAPGPSEREKLPLAELAQERRQGQAWPVRRLQVRA